MKPGADTSASQYGWKFLRDDCRSSFGSEPPWQVGETRSHVGRIALCDSGYHDAPTIFDALHYAQGNVLARTKVGGDSIVDDIVGRAKRVSQELTVLAIRDVECQLRLYACDCARRAMLRERAIGVEPHKSLWKAIRFARLYAYHKAPIWELKEMALNVWAVRDDAPTESARTIVSAVAYTLSESAVRAAFHAGSWATLAIARSPSYLDGSAYNQAAYSITWRDEIEWQQKRLDKLIAPLFVGVER